MLVRGQRCVLFLMYVRATERAADNGNSARAVHSVSVTYLPNSALENGRHLGAGFFEPDQGTLSRY